jgi:hypothetical protein
MKAPSECTLFSVGETSYSLSDLILAAKLWGDWDDIEKEVRQGLACVKWMEEEDEDIDDAEVESAANEFRYERDLLTTEETEAWLQQWELSIDEWMECMQRSALRGKLAAQLDEIEARHAAGKAEVERCAHAEAICSGHARRLAQKLAARLSAYQRALAEGWLEQAGESGAEKLPEALEAAYEEFCRKTVTKEGIRNQVQSHHLDWIRLDYSYLPFAAENMAREALLCIRDDGMSFNEVAENAKTAVQTGLLYLDEIDPDLWNVFLAAQKGGLVGPLKWHDEFALFLIRDKILPSIDDPQVRERGEQALLSAVLGQEMAKRVTWHKRL